MDNERDQGARLTADLRALGVRAGGVLLFHSSVRSLGPLAIGLDDVVAGLCAALDGGTLLLPTLSYATVDWTDPVFHMEHTPSCVGALPEYFRRMPGVRRSLHLTHSVAALGPDAEEITGDHALDTTPVGPHSPLHKLPGHGGQILMLGCGLGPNTSMHGVEELVEPPYLFGGPPVAYTCVDAEGRTLRLATRTHQFAGYAQRYERVAEVLESGAELREGSVLDATAYLIEAEALWRKCEAMLRKDPLYFVDRVGGTMSS